jgi:hypothetical protein
MSDPLSYCSLEQHIVAKQARRQEHLDAAAAIAREIEDALAMLRRTVGHRGSPARHVPTPRTPPTDRRPAPDVSAPDPPVVELPSTPYVMAGDEPAVPSYIGATIPCKECGESLIRQKSAQKLHKKCAEIRLQRMRQEQSAARRATPEHRHCRVCQREYYIPAGARRESRCPECLRDHLAHARTLRRGQAAATPAEVVKLPPAIARGASPWLS